MFFLDLIRFKMYFCILRLSHLISQHYRLYICTTHNLCNRTVSNQQKIRNRLRVQFIHLLKYLNSFTRAVLNLYSIVYFFLKKGIFTSGLINLNEINEKIHESRNEIIMIKRKTKSKKQKLKQSIENFTASRPREKLTL